MSNGFRVPRVYEVDGRRFRLPSGLDRPPRHWRAISLSQRLREQPPPLRSVSADDLALTISYMRAVTIIAATEIPPRNRSHLKYAAYFEQIRSLPIGRALKLECDDASEARKLVHAIRQQFQSRQARSAPTPVVIQCQLDPATHTAYVSRVTTPSARLRSTIHATTKRGA